MLLRLIIWMISASKIALMHIRDVTHLLEQWLPTFYAIRRGQEIFYRFAFGDSRFVDDRPCQKLELGHPLL